MKRWTSTMFGMLLLSTSIASPSFALGKGSSLFSLELTNGTADLYSVGGPGGNYITAFEHSEIGVQAQTWRFLSDEFAMTVSASFGYFGERDKPFPTAPGTPPEVRYSQTSYAVRVGGDRFVKVGERTVLYFGPGIEYWSGKAKYEVPGSSALSWEDQSVSRYSVSGRFGAILKLNDSVGFTGQIGRKLGLASATDNGAKATWWPSSFDATGGVVVGLGEQ